MSGGKRRSGLQITSVTSDFNQTPASQPPPMLGLSVIQSAGSSSCTPQGSSSQPITPSPKRKYTSHYASGPTTGSSSRFRVVRLAMGGADNGRRGQPYHHGRWTCTDIMERQEGEGFTRVINTVRHAHSLESLEMIGRYKDRGRAHLAQSVKGSDGTGLVLHSGPPSPTHREPDNLRLLDCKQPVEVQSSTPASPLPGPRNVPCPLRLAVDPVGWPRPPPAGLRHPSLTLIQTPAAFTLDQTILNLPGDTRSEVFIGVKTMISGQCQTPSPFYDSTLSPRPLRHPPSTPPLPLRSVQLVVAKQPETPVVLRDRRKVRGHVSGDRKSWPGPRSSWGQTIIEAQPRTTNRLQSHMVPSASPPVLSQNAQLPVAPYPHWCVRATPSRCGSETSMMSLLHFFHSSSSNHLMAIDNKIDQAMDLVKSHLMLAVREEVELLREQIRELQERNQLLERENLILRTLKHTT